MVTGYLMLNKDIIISLIASIALSAVIAELLIEQEAYLNSTYTLASGYVIYYTVFITLYYIDNRKEYRLESGGTDTARLKTDLLKIVFSFGVGELVFAVVRWTGQYYLLTLGQEPYIASVISHTVASIILLGIINLTAKKAKLYK